MFPSVAKSPSTSRADAESRSLVGSVGKDDVRAVRQRARSATRCCCPPDRSTGAAPCFSAMPRSPAARSRIVEPLCAGGRRGAVAARRSRPQRRYQVEELEHEPPCADADARDRSREPVDPLAVEPDLTRRRSIEPGERLSNVDFPHPLGPMMATTRRARSRCRRREDLAPSRRRFRTSSRDSSPRVPVSSDSLLQRKSLLDQLQPLQVGLQMQDRPLDEKLSRGRFPSASRSAFRSRSDCRYSRRCPSSRCFASPTSDARRRTS